VLKRPLKPRLRLNLNMFTVILTVVILALMFLFMGMPGAVFRAARQHGWSVDLARVDNPKSMPLALREDAVIVTITRDGRVYLATELGYERVTPNELPPRIRRELVRTGGERKIYIEADGRTKYGNVEEVVYAVRASGVENIAFLAYKRDPQDPN
jgi:biopolymer transport protein TolR